MRAISFCGSRRARVLAAALWLLGAAVAGARQEITVPVPERVPLLIKITTPYSVLPSSGYAPMEVMIDNGGGSRGEWTFHFTQSGWGAYQRDTWTSQATFAVDAHSQRTFSLLVPLASPGLKSNPLMVTTSGPGVVGEMFETLQTGVNYTSGRTPAFMGVSDGLTLDITHSARLKADENVARLAATELPGDWRGLSGFDALCLLASELGTLSAAQRTALQDWVATGGVLHLYGATERPASFGPDGLGQVALHAEPRIEVPEAVVAGIRAPRVDWLSADEANHWEALREIPRVRPNVPLLTALLVALAVTIGPINLYGFAGKGRRARLLWTTPLISLGASVALVLMIFLQDGMGGTGVRQALILLLPGQSKAVVRQEQVARTGVLMGADFHLANPSLLRPIVPEVVGTRDERSFAARGQDYSGAWFSNRARQGCLIQTVIPTRGEVQLLNPEALGNDELAPAVVSSIDVPLEEIYVRTGKFAVWHGAQLRAGERQTLTRTDQGDVPNLLSEALPELRHALDGLPKTPGTFVARTSDPRAFQETLPAIRWKAQRAVYAGQLIPAK